MRYSHMHVKLSCRSFACRFLMHHSLVVLLHQDDELEYTSHELCLQHADFGHQCSTMLVLRGQLLDASPVGNNCFVRTLVAAAAAFTSKFSAFRGLEYEAGRECLYQIARAAQTGEMRHGYPMSFVDQVCAWCVCGGVGGCCEGVLGASANAIQQHLNATLPKGPCGTSSVYHSKSARPEFSKKRDTCVSYVF